MEKEILKLIDFYTNWKKDKEKINEERLQKKDYINYVITQSDICLMNIFIEDLNKLLVKKVGT